LGTLHPKRFSNQDTGGWYKAALPNRLTISQNKKKKKKRKSGFRVVKKNQKGVHTKRWEREIWQKKQWPFLVQGRKQKVAKKNDEWGDEIRKKIIGYPAWGGTGKTQKLKMAFGSGVKAERGKGTISIQYCTTSSGKPKPAVGGLGS